MAILSLVPCLLLAAGMLSLAASATAQPAAGVRREGPVLTHAGMCEASGAVVLPQGRFAVANDEDNVIRIYAADQSGAPLAGGQDVGQILGLDVAKDDDDKADFEAGARLGDRLYWLGSHSRSGKGRQRPQRQQFLAMPAVGTAQGLAAGTRPVSLLPALLASAPARALGVTAAIGTAATDEALAPERGGLNIEGMAPAPDGQAMLLGLRNPLAPDGRAIVLRLANPAAAVEGSEAPRIDAASTLALGGRGVRDMIFLPARNLFVVVAGPSRDEAGAKPFALYTWSGNAADEAHLVPGSDMLLAATDIPEFHPEAIIADATGRHLLLLSDDGDLRLADQGDKTCKKVAVSARRFRSIRLVLD